MKDNFSKALLARVSDFAKAKRLSPLTLASLASLANSEAVRDILSRAPIERISAFAKAERLSPLMLASLVLLANTTTLSALFLLRALIGWGDPEPAPIADWRPPAVSLKAPPTSAAFAADTQTLTRPVFAKSRRPSAQPVASAVANLGSGAQPTLGVEAIVFAKDGPRAYLAGQGGGSGDWYIVGQMADGWTVSEIRQSELVLKSGERSATLSLYPETMPADENEAKQAVETPAMTGPEKAPKAAVLLHREGRR